MERLNPHERIRMVAPAVLLGIGLVGIAGCANEPQVSEVETVVDLDSNDTQKEISDMIGQIMGVYDKDGNIIPSKTKNIQGKD